MGTEREILKVLKGDSVGQHMVSTESPNALEITHS